MLLAGTLFWSGCSTSGRVAIMKDAAGPVADLKDFVPADILKGNKILLVKVPFVDVKEIRNVRAFFSQNFLGEFDVVPMNVSADLEYPDLKVYRYMMVIGGAISASDFTGVSNRNQFFGTADSSFVRKGSSLYIFDRSSGHELYETGESYMVSETSTRRNGRYLSVLNYPKLKRYLKALSVE